MTSRLIVSLVWLGTLYVSVIGADFCSPYDYTRQDRTRPYAPPARLRFRDAQGRFHWRPFVCESLPLTGSVTAYKEDCAKTFPLELLVDGAPYRIAGFDLRLRLFGVPEPGAIYLMGTDDYGRDQFSRFLHGGRVSLFAGALACAVTLCLSLLLGVLGGFYGRWVDEGIMWLAELFLALPWLYLLFAVRAFFPLDMQPAAAFFLIITVIGIVGWARPARLIRGVVLSARSREYVLAARGFGASNVYIIRRHILPETRGVLLAQASLLIPRYVLAEVTLSFLGLGVNEPGASWGRMLSMLQHYHVLTSYWWIYLPGLMLIPTFLSFLVLSDTLHEKR